MIKAHAKINLGLFVVARRPDGYHEIRTVFHKIALYDVISFAASGEIAVRSSNPSAPSDERNLCFKAARLLQEHLGVPQGVTITLKKRIPVGAGLGGGSSDAALVLSHLPAFWKRSADELTLRRLAMQLGSDVPFFLGRGSATAQGRGELLEYFRLDVPYTILLCTPAIHISTAWAYQQIKPRSTTQHIDLRTLVTMGMNEPLLLVNGLRNDFEPAVFGAHPDIMRVKEVMVRGGAAFASLSGSGSSVYGLFAEAGHAEEAAETLRHCGHATNLTPPHFQAD